MNLLKKNVLPVLSAFLIILLSGCSIQSEGIRSEDNLNKPSLKTENQKDQISKYKNVNGKLRVDYIDVGQGDSILITQGKHSMLIDAGTNEKGKTVVNYIKNRGINKLDYLIGTHPHEDHIGGMDDVIRSLQIGKIYLPKVNINTVTFEETLKTIKAKGLKVSAPVPGSDFELGKAEVKIFGPVDVKESDLNTFSIVMKVQYGSNSFLFTGDAQISNEEAMLRKGYDLRADVLKIGHHGSNTSTGKDFLNAVKPSYAVISCGRGNVYRHPHKETVDELRAKGIKVYRTDEEGSITAISDGETTLFNKNPGDYRYGSQIPKDKSQSSQVSSNNDNNSNTQITKKDRTVYWTAYGNSYHYDKNCSRLKRSKNIISGPLSECPKKDPCDICVK